MPPATWNADKEMPKTLNNCAPPNAAKQRMAIMANAAFVASATFALDDLPALTFENIAAQITGLTSDRIVRMPWMY